MARDLGEHPHEPLASLRARLLGRVATEIQREHGDAGELEGKLPGEYLFAAGDLEAAQMSLVAACALQREAQPLYRLADVTFVRGDSMAARRLYLDALLLDPFERALCDVRDADVRELPSVVRYQIEIDAEPEAWSAPAGVVLGVLPRPMPDAVRALPPPAEALSPPRCEALGQARAFVEALARSGTSPPVELRRTLKALSPQLFAAYMRSRESPVGCRRFVRRGHGPADAARWKVGPRRRADLRRGRPRRAWLVASAVARGVRLGRGVAEVRGTVGGRSADVERALPVDRRRTRVPLPPQSDPDRLR
jgi:hypothetical protein